MEKTLADHSEPGETLAETLVRYSGPLRLALDAYAACLVAARAAWRANGEPTDGTANALQRALYAATWEAERDARHAWLSGGAERDEGAFRLVVAGIRRRVEVES